MKTSILLAVSALALTACGDPSTDADADGDGTITQEEVEAAVADASIKPGQWENTVEFINIEIDEESLPEEMRGFIGPALEGMKGQVNTMLTCVTPEQAAEPQAEMFAGNEDASCEYQKFTFSGGTIDMQMSCNDPGSGNATISNTGTYTDESYEMQMSIAMEGSEMGNMTITASNKGEFKGACTGEEIR
ncbi:MAG: DUF3617 domain-containing protein [Erythrobacter sp.]